MSENGARKFDIGKSPITTGLLWRFPRAVKAVASVSAVGAEKYEVTLPDDNCLRVENGFNRYADAIARHLVDRIIDGPINNEKGGALPPEGRDVRHLAQLVWDGLTCLEIELIEEEEMSRKANPRIPAFPEDFQMGELNWWADWQQTKYPGAPSPTYAPLPPSPHNHCRIASSQECNYPKNDSGHPSQVESVPTGNAGKSQAR